MKTLKIGKQYHGQRTYCITPFYLYLSLPAKMRITLVTSIRKVGIEKKIKMNRDNKT